MASPSPDAAILMREAHVLKAAGRLKEALGLYRQAVSVNPASAVAEHNLAGALGDAGRWREAEPHLRSAFLKGLDAAETWLVLARCEEALGRHDAAEQAFEAAIARRRDLYDAHRELAQLRWMRDGDPDRALAGLERARHSAPEDVRLSVIRSEILSTAGRLQESAEGLARLCAKVPGDGGLALLASQAAGAAGDPAGALAFAEQANARLPPYPPVLITLAEACLMTGDARRAARVAARLRETAPTNQHAIALEATALRMLGDRTYDELYDYPSLVKAFDIDAPSGWPDRAAYLQDLTRALEAIHAYEAEPFHQSLRRGSQAAHLLQADDPAIRALPAALDGAVRAYIEGLGEGSDPLRRRRTASYVIEGMWSVRLRPGGFHIDHVHPMGWISSALHIRTVDRPGKEGWLRFGRPGVVTSPRLEAEYDVQPVAGRLVLFPAYMWHGTHPFEGDARRLTVAFDVLPGR
jgi:tetratricopeptide (TPR) repeat protein